MNRVSILLILCLFSAATLPAQETAKPQFHKHLLGVGFSNEMTVNQSGPFVNLFPSYGANVGMYYQYRPVKWFSAETGLGFLSYKTMVMGRYADPYGGSYSYHEAIPAIDFSPHAERWNNLLVPLNWRWHVCNKQTGIYILTGVAFNWLISRDAGKDFDTHFSSTNGYKDDVAMSVTVGMGIEHKLTDRILLRGEPVIRLYNAVYQREIDLRTVPTPSLGINIGAYYVIGKQE